MQTIVVLRDSSDCDLEIFADLDGHRESERPILSTLKESWVDEYPSTRRPDLVVFDKNRKHCALFELTVPFERNIRKQHINKINRYTYNEISLICFEIASRVLTKSNKKSFFVYFVSIFSL